jgi:SsrA-binding protein
MEKIYAQNKGIFINYDLIEKFSAGLKLFGFEVKSIKKGKISLQGALVKIENQRAFLRGASISPYQPKNIPKDYNKNRPIELLLNKKELSYLQGKQNQKGLTLIPIKLYNKKNLIKLEFSVAKHLKKYDKREKIKDKEVKRRIEKLKKI